MYNRHRNMFDRGKNMAQKIILTGDRPTGKLHVGHYVGSLKRRVELQNSGEYDKIFIMIADAQALTDNADNPAKVRSNIMEVALDYLSVGIDPAKSNIFIQSYVTELTELTFYYMNLVTVSRLQRNPTVKSEIQMRNFETSIPVGFFCYPISQAADITAFHATTVPVGEDQMPMLEQTKEIVHKFNAVYGETLTDPQILLPENKACLRLPGTDGKAKMSKSLGNCIYLSEPEADVKKKIMAMYTDPNHIRIEDPGNLEGNTVFKNRGVGADGRICPGLKKYDRSERGIYDHKCHIRPWGGDRHCNRDGYENRRYRKIAFRDKNGTDTAAEKTCGSWENSWYSFRFFVYPAVCDGGFAETQCRRNADHRDITGGRSSPGRTAGDRYDGTGTFGITHGKGQYDCEKTAECGNFRLCECGMFG